MKTAMSLAAPCLLRTRGRFIVSGLARAAAGLRLDKGWLEALYSDQEEVPAETHSGILAAKGNAERELAIP